MKRYVVALLGTLLMLASCAQTASRYEVTLEMPESVEVVYEDQPIYGGPGKKHSVEKLFAGVMFGECRGDTDCLNAVGHVILNRVRSNLDKRYGKGMWGVLNKRKAFSCLLKSDSNRPVIEAAMRERLDADTPDGKAWKKAKKIAHKLLYSRTYDPTNAATYYHATYVNPAWVEDSGMVRVAKIGFHIFYRKEA